MHLSSKQTLARKWCNFLKHRSLENIQTETQTKLERTEQNVINSSGTQIFYYMLTDFPHAKERKRGQ